MNKSSSLEIVILSIVGLIVLSVVSLAIYGIAIAEPPPTKVWSITLTSTGGIIKNYTFNGTSKPKVYNSLGTCFVYDPVKGKGAPLHHVSDGWIVDIQEKKDD